MGRMKLLRTADAAPRSLGLATVVALLAALAGMPATAAPKERYAWLDQGSPRQPEVVMIQRGGKALPYPEDGLQKCDVVEWKDPQQPVLIRLSDGRKFLFNKGNAARQFKVPCDQPGIAESVMQAINAFLGVGETSRLLAAASVSSRTAALNQPLSIPLLDAPRLALVAKTRALHLRWVGGQGPFDVSLVNARTSEVIASRTGIAAHEVTLPAVALAPGTYRLKIQQADRTGLVADDLVAVAASELPAMPPSLQAATLPHETREVMYADFLASRPDGLWKLEAAQRLADLARTSAAARNWLQLESGQAADAGGS